MTTRSHLRKVLLICCLTITGLTLFGSRPVAAQTDPCTEAVTPPAGGFTVNNTTGVDPQSPIIHLQFYGAGDATYAEVSNSPDFSNSAFYEVAYPYDGQADWTIAPGYGPKQVHVRYVNSCKAMPGATVIVEVTYFPSFCNIAPTGTFGVSSSNGPTITSPNVTLTFASGNAAYAMVSNAVDFSNPTTVGVGYPYENILNWTISTGYGAKTVHVRYYNECMAQPTAVVTVAFYYPNPSCVTAINPNGLMITSLGPTNVRLGYPTRVTVVPHGNNANKVLIADDFNFKKNATWYDLTPNMTIPRNLPPGTGSKTVWALYWYKNDGCPDIMASYAVSISYAVTR